MHQRPNPIHFFFQREMGRVEKMELCAGNISAVRVFPGHVRELAREKLPYALIVSYQTV